jgi:hypothetical protein
MLLLLTNKSCCYITSAYNTASLNNVGIFWGITAFSSLKVNQNESRWQAEPFRMDFCLAYPSTLKAEAIYSSETSVDFQWTTRCYVPEGRTLHNHRCENLKFYISNLIAPEAVSPFVMTESLGFIINSCMLLS